MTLEEIIDEWVLDSDGFDITDLSEEAHKGIKFHAKYGRYKALESVLLRNMKIAYQKLKAEKEEFLQNPSQEVIKAKGWKVPARGRILKADIATHLGSDPEMIKMELSLGKQEEKVEFLKDILKQLNQRSYTIRNILDDRKFLNGGG